MGYLEKLNILDALPPGLLELDSEDLHQKLDGPSLIHLKGQKEPAILVCVLLHGNEHTSWQALQALLKEYQNRPLPRSISIFIGNVSAARYNIRRLDQGSDYNRIWGSQHQAAHPLMQEVIEEMHTRGIFLSLDIHNNTGKNPHYACVNRLDKDFLYLASLFSRDVVYFLKPEGVQSMAFSKLCPSITVECGLSGENNGIRHARDLISACLHLADFPEKALGSNDLRIYHTVAIVKVNPAYEFSFSEDPSNSESELVLDQHLELTNFSELLPGKVLGNSSTSLIDPLIVLSEEGNNVSEQYLEIMNNTITLKRKVIPAMFTLNRDNIRKDCLCYFMEPYPVKGLR